MLYSEESEMSSGSYDLLNTTGINGINLLSFHLDSMPYNVTLSRQKKNNRILQMILRFATLAPLPQAHQPAIGTGVVQNLYYFSM